VSPTERSRAPRSGNASQRRPQSSSAAKRALRRGTPQYQTRLVLQKRNYMILAAGAVSILIGFFLLSNKEISLSPALLVLGYCVLIPMGLLWEHVPGKSGASPSRPAAGAGGGVGGEGE